MQPAAPQVPANADRTLARTSRCPATRMRRKAHLRRLALDWLEPRTLLALPAPTVSAR